MRIGKENPLISYTIFFVPVLLILFYWKNILLNLSTHLYSLLDVPFVIWVLQNNIRHFANLDFGILYETNAMYPFPLSLSFTEHMFFPSAINLVISWFTRSPVVQFNLLAVFNHLMVYFCFYLLAGRFTKNRNVRIITSAFVSFSPYLIGQISHFQMVFFWPFLLSAYYMFHTKRTNTQAALAGMWLGFQFLSSVYLAIIGLVALFVYMLFLFSKEHVRELAIQGAIVLIVFFVVAWPSASGYLEMQKTYKPTYEQSQYVTYAAHLSDYFLHFPNDSILNMWIMKPFIGSLNRHNRGELAAFIGLVPLITIGISLFLYKRKTESKNDNLRTYLWLIVLICFGMVFSLGPRANWNGSYLVFPLPYWFVLKFVPFIGVMRAVARWYFLVIFPISIFLVFGLNKIVASIKTKTAKIITLILISILLLLEFYPSPLKAEAFDWNTESNRRLAIICETEPGPLLEYPFDRFDRSSDIGKDLAYKTKNLFISTQHNCEILSGFSAYEPEKYQIYRSFFQDNEFNLNQLILLNRLGFKYVRFNLDGMEERQKKDIATLMNAGYMKMLYADEESILAKTRKITIIKLKDTSGKEIKQFKAED